MSTQTVRRLHACARCGRKVTADRAMFSRFTRNHYCMAIDECSRRAGTYKR